MGFESDIASVAIYPGIGIARVGNSDEFFIGPEVPNPVAPPEGGYRDPHGRLKRQAARFRIYAFDAKGRVLGEVTAEQADIHWRVQVANKKAAWYNFVTAMDIPEATPTRRRNQNFVGDERRRLEITPPPAEVCGRQACSDPMVGRFLDQEVYLGELRTDHAGRLLMLGGKGVSSSPFADNSVYTFANNDGWHDDVSDGPVDATVRLADGRELQAKVAWVSVAPPNYAPDLLAIVTLYDVMVNAYIGNWMEQKDQPSFKDDIYPILERFCTTEWVNQGFFNQFGWQAPNEFTRADLLARLAQGGSEFEELRRQIFNQFRYPEQLNSNIQLTVPDNRSLSAGTSVQPWPWFYGDAVTLSDPSPNAYLSVTELMYQYLGQWAAGEFEADGLPEPYRSLADVALAEQPATLDKANLTYCLGGAFHPGCELTWPMRNTTMYSEPFRVRRRDPGDPEPDYGPVLRPEQVFSNGGPTPGGPLYFNAPGDLTRYMAVPWQTDTSSCRSGYQPEYDPYLPTFWPDRVPNQVLTEASYAQVMDPELPLDERVEAFNQRAVWYRFLGPDWDYLGQISTMVERFGDLGLILERPGPGIPELPPRVFVESGVQFGRRVPDRQGAEMVWKEKLRTTGKSEE